MTKLRQPFDLHVHTTWSDAKSTPEEVVNAAIARGMEMIGFSDHSYTSHDASWGLSASGEDEYRAEIKRLKEKYRGKIGILCGVEQDYYSGRASDEFDYVVGSVHSVCVDGEHICVDWRESAEAGVRDHFGGDWYAFCETYYAHVADIVAVTGADIVGHFDLVTIYNEDGEYFDMNCDRYRRAWQAAADKLLLTGAVFEINTGAMSRGYRTKPYPAQDIVEYIRARGGRFILSSDAHTAQNIAYGFDTYAGEADASLRAVIK